MRESLTAVGMIAAMAVAGGVTARADPVAAILPIPNTPIAVGDAFTVTGVRPTPLLILTVPTQPVPAWQVPAVSPPAASTAPARPMPGVPPPAIPGTAVLIPDTANPVAPESCPIGLTLDPVLKVCVTP